MRTGLLLPRGRPTSTLAKAMNTDMWKSVLGSRPRATKVTETSFFYNWLNRAWIGGFLMACQEKKATRSKAVQKIGSNRQEVYITSTRLFSLIENCSKSSQTLSGYSVSVTGTGTEQKAGGETEGKRRSRVISTAKPCQLQYTAHSTQHGYLHVTTISPVHTLRAHPLSSSTPPCTLGLRYKESQVAHAPPGRHKHT